MVDLDVVGRRLGALEGYIARLREFRAVPRDDFLAQPDVHHLAERYLHLATECVLDLAQHLISDLGLRHPEGYRDTMRVLAEAEVLQPELAQRLEGWMGFRNVLAHLYLEIDHGIAYSVIENDLEDLEHFAAGISAWLA